MPSRTAGYESLDNLPPSRSRIDLNSRIDRQVLVHFRRLSRKYRGIEGDDVRQTIRIAAWEAQATFDEARGSFDNFVGFIADKKLSKAKRVRPSEGSLEDVSYQPFIEELVDFRRKFSLA